MYVRELCMAERCVWQRGVYDIICQSGVYAIVREVCMAERSTELGLCSREVCRQRGVQAERCAGRQVCR